MNSSLRILQQVAFVAVISFGPLVFAHHPGDAGDVRSVSTCYEDLSYDDCFTNRPFDALECTIDFALSNPQVACSTTDIEYNNATIRGYNLTTGDYKSSDFAVALCSDLMFYVNSAGEQVQTICHSWKILNDWAEG